MFRLKIFRLSYYFSSFYKKPKLAHYFCILEFWPKTRFISWNVRSIVVDFFDMLQTENFDSLFRRKVVWKMKLEEDMESISYSASFYIVEGNSFCHITRFFNAYLTIALFWQTAQFPTMKYCGTNWNRRALECVSNCNISSKRLLLTKTLVFMKIFREREKNFCCNMRIKG